MASSTFRKKASTYLIRTRFGMKKEEGHADTQMTGEEEEEEGMALYVA